MKAALFGATLIVGAASANAADVNNGSVKDGPIFYSPPIGWGGFYAGVNLGSTLDDSIVDIDETDLDIEDSLTGGAHVGYNWQKYSNWLYGFEADVSFIDDELQDEGVDQITNALITFRGRFGYSAGRTLLYATGGLGLLSFDSDFDPNEILDDPTIGWVAGGGVEHKFRPNWSMGAEALYYDFSSDVEGGGELDRDFWTIKARVSYHVAPKGRAPLK